MSSDSDSDDEYDPALPVQLLSVRSSSYLRSEGFSKSDVQELASECRMLKYLLLDVIILMRLGVGSGQNDNFFVAS